MDLIDEIQALAARIPNQLEHLQTEEATKTAFVMPFINALGYNVFDPTEIVPEFTADFGGRKGEKVDYAIMRDGKPIILFECKVANANLDDNHASQLFRYFTATEARFGILTNGRAKMVAKDGMSLRQLAKGLGVSHSFLSRIASSNHRPAGVISVHCLSVRHKI